VAQSAKKKTPEDKILLARFLIMGRMKNTTYFTIVFALVGIGQSLYHSIHHTGAYDYKPVFFDKEIFLTALAVGMIAVGLRILLKADRRSSYRGL
jgi:hypothetical protein